MRKKLSRLKWNFVSIFVITLLGISLFHFFTGPKEKKYKLIEDLVIEITCLINSNVNYYYADLCPKYQKALQLCSSGCGCDGSSSMSTGSSSSTSSY